MSDWQYTNQQAFLPDRGKCYELVFDQTTKRRIRIDPDADLTEVVEPSAWIDLSTQKNLSRQEVPMVVQAYREIDCPEP